MPVVPVRRPDFAARLVAPATALVLVAVQVAANAARAALFLSSFRVTTLPWFVALAALTSFPAALGAGSLLVRYGPGRAVPALLGLSFALFVGEAVWLRPYPTLVAVVIYFHAAVLGAIVVSSFWSLLDERFDAYTAKRVFSRVAAAATLGSMLGGLGAERLAAAYQSPRALLLVLAAGTAMCLTGAVLVGRRGERTREGRAGTRLTEGYAALARLPYLRVLTAVTMLAALVGTLCDYLLNADAAAHVAAGAPLIRFFGLFYAATGVAAFLLQATLAPAVLSRLGVASTLALHPLAAGAASLISLVVPSPWRGILPRSADVTVRHSLFRTGYELLFTPLPDATRRVAKGIIDVGWDCAGTALGAAIVFLLTRLTPSHDLVAIAGAGVLAAGIEFWAARRLRSGYVHTLDDDLRRRGEGLPITQTFSRFTVLGELSVRDSSLDVRSAGGIPAPSTPFSAALADLHSNDVARVRAALRRAGGEPMLVGALIALLDRTDLFDDVARTLRACGTRVAGQLADALVDPGSTEVVRRRLPLLLESCPCRRALGGLVEGLSDPSLSVRLRCGRALLKLTSSDTTLVVPREIASAAAERELDAGSGEERSLSHVFDLLALAFDRGGVEMARRAVKSGDTHARGTALAYLDATLPRTLFAKLERRVGGEPARQPVGKERGTGDQGNE